MSNGGTEQKDKGGEKPKSREKPKDSLKILEDELLKSPADINLSTKIKALNQKLEFLNEKKIQAKNKQENMSIQEKINSVVREKNRIIRFYVISKGKDKTKSVDNIEKEDIDTISAKKLLQIEKEKTGFFSSAFAYKQIIDSEGNITEEPLTNLGDIKEGDKILIDFGKNAGAYWKVGAGDILPKNIKVVKITDKNGNTRIGVRGVQGNKVGYYDEKGYIPVFNNYIIDIPKKDDEKKLLALIDNNKLEITQGDETVAKIAYIDNLDKAEAREANVRAMSLEANKNFIENATKIAKEIEKSYGIPWQVTLGQASLESGFGKSGLAREGNFFGIKGPGKTFSTKENYGGKEITIQDSFKVYGDMKESFLDYARLLTQKPRYRNAFKYAVNIEPRPEYYPKDYNPSDYNPEKFIDTVIKAGYATDPHYVTKITNLWRTHNIDSRQVA